MPGKVTVIARIVVRPDAVDEVEAALRTLVSSVTTDEPGAVQYVLHREGDSPSFWFYEVYEDQAAFDAHGNNPALAAAFGSFGGKLAEPPELHLLTPLQAKGLDL